MFWLLRGFFGFFLVVVVGIQIDLRGLTKAVHGRSPPDRTADYSRETYGQRVRIPVVINSNRSCLLRIPDGISTVLDLFFLSGSEPDVLLLVGGVVDRFFLVEQAPKYNFILGN
jgi:hypothetical protein